MIDVDFITLVPPIPIVVVKIGTLIRCLVGIKDRTDCPRTCIAIIRITCPNRCKCSL